MSDAENSLLGMCIGCVSLDHALEQVEEAIEKDRQVVFACSNTHSLVVSQDDETFNRALRDADILVADGVGVTLAGRMLGIDVGQRIAGEQFFSAVMEKYDAGQPKRVFFMGSTPQVLEGIEEKFNDKYPNLEFAGSYSPPYGDISEEENDRIIAVINDSQTDILWVGMTAPKQEKWAYENRSKLKVSLIGSVGAVFDFFAGTKKSPPWYIRKFGLETFYLLATNPKRTWKRLFISAPRYLFILFNHHVLGRS